MSESFNIESGVRIIQLPPDNIPLYWVQETELLIVSKGGDALAGQLSLAAGGVAAGAVPGAIAAISSLVSSGKIDDPVTLVALILVITGASVSIVCACIHRRHKSYPQKLLESILSRKAS